MIIIELMPGGLASQMTSYSVYKKFKLLKPDTQLDISYFQSVDPNEYKKMNLHNGYELNRVFGLEPSLAKIEDVEFMKDSRRSFVDRIRRKFFGIRKTHYFEKSLNFVEDIFKLDNKYISGYWMSLKYFEDIRNELLKDFAFKLPLNEKNASVLKKILDENSVAVHIRRGDFVNNKLHGNICDLDYYKRALSLVSKLVAEPSYFVFSDDPTWARENFSDLLNVHFINWNLGNDSYVDMLLMSRCKHNIISNSGFGWWAAWLNTNENKFVITPKKWLNLNQFDYTQFVPKEWISV